MPLLNYTTTIDAAKTVGEIERNLAKHGARAILKNYDDDGHIESLSFIIQYGKQEIPFKLPVDPDAVLRVLERQGVPPRYCNRPQAVRIAWRIVKDWVAAQMAILETEMVRMEQVFLPYMVSGSGKTLYEAMLEKQFLLKAWED
jgi:hypothetical protein